MDPAGENQADRSREIPEGLEREASPVRPWSSFLIRDFSLIWVANLFTATAVQIRHVSSLYQVYDLSGSSLQLGLAGFFQALPFVVFGLFAGALADVLDRKRLILITQCLNLVPGLALALLTRTGAIQVWHIYLFSLTTSLVQVFSWPARSAIIPSLVPQSHLMNAVTLSTTIQQSSFLFGPVLAGMLIDRVGLDYTYFLESSLFVPSVLMILAVRSSGKPEGAQGGVSLRGIIEGLRFIWIERIILSLFLLDFGVTLVGFYRPILPIFARDVFNMGATGLGTLYAAPAVGALLGSAALLLLGNVRRKGALAVIAAVFFAGSLALLGVSTWFWMAVVAVAALGITDAISVTLRRTVVQFLAPDAMRGRASSLITVFAQATNALGALLAGAAAALLGAPQALLAGGLLCVVIVFGISRSVPQLWRYRSD